LRQVIVRNSLVVRSILLGAVLTAGFAVLLQARPAQKFVSAGRHHGLVMAPVQQKDCPLTIRSTTHATVDALTSGELQNASDKTIVAYKIGWLYVIRDGGHKTESTVGKIMNAPGGIAPEATTIVPAQGVWVAQIPEAAKSVAFFVAFADGSRFTADVNDVADRAVKDAAKAKVSFGGA
jgi:hypothetical protein